VKSRVVHIKDEFKACATSISMNYSISRSHKHLNFVICTFLKLSMCMIFYVNFSRYLVT
jgi:hypothetical protein